MHGFGQEIVFDELVTRGTFSSEIKSYPSPKNLHIEQDEDFLYLNYHFKNADSAGFKAYLSLDSATWNHEISLNKPIFLSHLPTGVHTIINIRVKNAAHQLVATNYLTIYVNSPIWTKWWVNLLLFAFVLSLLSLIAFFYSQQNIRQIRQTFLLREKMHHDLHDEMGTSLGSINLLVNHLKKKISKISTTETDHLFAEVETQIRDTHEEMRDLMWAIKPQKQQIDSIFKKINHACDGILTPANVGFQLNETGDLTKFTLQPDQNYQLVRFFKEAIYNIVKHAQAEFVDISAGFSENRFHLIIEDNGVGFDVSEEKTGTGLHSLKNRAAALKAEYLIESVAGEGTTISLSFPVRS